MAAHNQVMETQVKPGPDTAARLLVVDDEPHIRTPVARALALHGYFVEEAGSGLEALVRLNHTPYNLMVLDLLMPGLDGVEVMHRARELQPELLVLILTGHATIDNAIAALKADVVDYMVKPVSTNEIIEVIARALQRESRRLTHHDLFSLMKEALTAPPTTSKLHRFIRVVPLILDSESRQVAIDDDIPRLIELTAGETKVLATLMIQPGHVFSCCKLVEAGWGHTMAEAEARILIRPHISRLRVKLEANPKTPPLIHTVRHHGYYFASFDTI
jgi:two-component system KDP operon response regulator KdpE